MTLATWREKCATIWLSLVNCYKAYFLKIFDCSLLARKIDSSLTNPMSNTDLRYDRYWSSSQQKKIIRRVPSENSFNLRLSKWASFTWILSLVHSLWQSYKTNDSCLRLWISHEVILGSMSLRTKHAIFELSSFPSHTNSKTHIFLIMPAWAWTTDRLSI